MKELLSNEEIDTLLEMFRSGEEMGGGDVIPPVEMEPKRESLASRVDLLKPNRISREHMHKLERVYEACAKTLSATMTDNLRFDMKCDCVAVEQIRFTSWLESIGSAAVIYSLDCANYDGNMLCSMTSNLLYGAVDRILGGSGKIDDAPREFSEAEYTVADAFTDPCLQQIAVASNDLLPGPWRIASRFTNPSMANVIPSQDVVLSVHFQTGGDFLLGDIRLALPYQAIEDRLRVFGDDAADHPDSERNRHVLSESVRPVLLDMVVQLGATQLPIRQLLGLKVGDVVPVETRLGEPLTAPVQGRPKFKGHVGTLGNRLAYQVGRVLEA